MNCDIDGVVIREISKHHDDRGWLAELFRHDEMDADCYPAMAYVSVTRPGVARGPHEHAEQTDLFCFLGPSTFRLYLWDNRESSPTFGAKAVLDLGEAKHALVIVPPGVVHAYRNIGDIDGLIFNAPNRLYAGEGKRQPVDEIRHEDDPESPFQLD